MKTPRGSAERAAHLERLISIAPSPLLAYGVAAKWLDEEAEMCGIHRQARKEIRKQLQVQVWALNPGLSRRELTSALVSTIANLAAGMSAHRTAGAS
jgi:hypothetical protein